MFNASTLFHNNFRVMRDSAACTSLSSSKPIFLRKKKSGGSGGGSDGRSGGGSGGANRPKPAGWNEMLEEKLEEMALGVSERGLLV
jgi:hypothetical protein